MSSETHGHLMLLIGGVALFMYGLTLASDYLQRLAANRVRALLAKLNDRHWLAILVGVALTVLLQSSGAVTSMLVGLGSAEVINLRQVMGVIIGTAIGSTLTVQLISFNLMQWGLPIFTIGFTCFFLGSNRNFKNFSGVVLGFGLLFIGLEMMSNGTSAVKSSELMLDIFQRLKENPVLTVILTAALTGFIHSSAVVIGLAMSLTSSNVLTMTDAMFWVYGANVGTTSTALFAAARANYIGRQVAWAHFLYKVGSVILFLAFTERFANWMLSLSSDGFRGVANAHAMFNIVSAIVFYPFIGIGAKQIERLVPRSETEKAFGPKYIVREIYDNPALAFEKARRETMRMGDIVMYMLQDSIDLFRKEDHDLFERIKKQDTQVDLLHRTIKMFTLKSCSNGSLNPQVVQLVSYVTDLESAADVIDKGLVVLAKKKHALKLEFSNEGWQELCDFHQQVIEAVAMSQSSFALQDQSLALKVIEKKRLLRGHERTLKHSHLQRLTEGREDSIKTSSIHIDTLNDYQRIVSLLSSHAYTLAGLKSGIFSTPEQRGDEDLNQNKLVDDTVKKS
jgi:phosphate:Na+ symporter